MSPGNPERPVGGLSVRTPPGVELRPLGRDDFDDALAMARELYELEEDDPAPHRWRFEAHLNSVDAASFLALADGRPAGVNIFSFRRRLNHATFEGWVSDLFVHVWARRRGIGRALMQAGIEEWRLRGGHRLTLETADDNGAARSLYESVGMTDRGRFYQLRPVVAGPVATLPGVEIRRIAEHDFESVTRLLAELGRPAPSEEALPALRRTYLDHLRAPTSGSLIATLDGDAVGFVSLEFRQPFVMTATQAWIPDLIVTDRARGQGIGRALLQAAVAESARRDAYGVVLESGHHRAAAHALYESAGMRPVGNFFALDRDAGR